MQNDYFMTTSEWLRLAYFPCLFVALGMLSYVGVKYSQGKELPRRKQRRVLLVGAIALTVGVGLYAASWIVWIRARPVADPPVRRAAVTTDPHFSTGSGTKLNRL